MTKICRPSVGVFRTPQWGEVYLPPTPLRWTPSPALRPNPRSPVTTFLRLKTPKPNPKHPKMTKDLPCGTRFWHILVKSLVFYDGFCDLAGQGSSGGG